MTDIPQAFQPPKPSLVVSLPKHLKDPTNYEKINRFIIESLASKHSHGDMMAWAACVSCQRRFAERGGVLKKLGFKNPGQYMLWKRVHEHIRRNYTSVSLPKYDE